MKNKDDDFKEFLDEEIDQKELTTYSYISNGLYFEYFIGYEISALLGYKNTRDVIKNNVSICNKLEFKDFPGVKEPKINSNIILISRDGVPDDLTSSLREQETVGVTDAGVAFSLRASFINSAV